MDTFIKLLLICYVTGGEEGAQRFVGGYFLGILICVIVLGFFVLLGSL
jgi:hypothetical protein